MLRKGLIVSFVVVALALITGALRTIEPQRGSASSIVFVAAGSSSGHTCASLDGGNVRCWGRNSYGQLGDGTMSNRSTPTAVNGLNGVSALALGNEHTCAIADGSLWCWGRNSEGQLGMNSASSSSAAPLQVPGLSDVIDVATGYTHTCALRDDGVALCWGNNLHGQLGTGAVDGETHAAPQPVAGLGGQATAIVAGDWHTCAVLVSGSARCWGENIHGQAGNGQTGINQPTPATPNGLSSGVVALDGGAVHTCALLATGTVRCWGRNWYGQLGDGTFTDSAVPIDVDLPFAATSVSTGGNHTCAASSAGQVACWGRGLSGQIGSGSTDDEAVPVIVSGLDALAVSLAAGARHSCASTSGGELRCWGENEYGQVGDGTTVDRYNPVPAAAKGAQPPTPTSGPDSDSDGCDDERETGADERSGGLRDASNVWDFFDTPDMSNARDRSIAGTDFFRLLARFGATGDAMMDPLSMPPAASGYHTAFDRGASSGPNAWNLTAANGSISGTDFFAMLVQFGHSCA